MKTSLSLILSLLLALLCVSPASGAAPVRDAVSITVGSVEAEPGETVSIPVNISGEYSASALTLSLDYDPSLLQLTGSLVRGSVWTEIQSAGGMAMSNVNTPGRIVFSGIVYNIDASFSSSGTLFTANFIVSESAEAGTVIPIFLTISQFTFDHIDGTVTPIPFIASNGSVSIPTPEPAGVTGDVDCSGSVDMSDISMLFSFLNGGSISISDQGMINADANHDGKINVMDITAIFSLIANS